LGESPIRGNDLRPEQGREEWAFLRPSTLPHLRVVGEEEMKTGPERPSILACSPVPGAGTSYNGERRARRSQKGRRR